MYQVWIWFFQETKAGIVARGIAKTVAFPVRVGTEIVIFTVELGLGLLIELIRLPFHFIYEVFTDLGKQGYKAFTPKLIKRALKDATRRYREEKKMKKDKYHKKRSEYKKKDKIKTVN